MKGVSNRQPTKELLLLHGWNTKPAEAIATSLSQLFTEFRHYERFGEGPLGNVTYSFERMVYVSILEYKIHSFLATSNQEPLRKMFSSVSSVLREIPKQVKMDVTPFLKSVEQLEALVLGNGDSFKEFEITTVISMIPNLDSAMIKTARAIIMAEQASWVFGKNTYDETTQIEGTPERVGKVCKAFNVSGIMYTDMSKFPPLTKNLIYFGCFGKNCFLTFYPKPEHCPPSQVTTLSAIIPSQPPTPSPPQPPPQPSTVNPVPANTQSLLLRHQSQLNPQMTSKSKEPVLKLQPLESSIFISCDLCQHQSLSSECLSYNYKYYCQNCIFNPQTELPIPPHHVQRFCQQHRLPNLVKIQCPECSSLSFIHNYSPSNKPSLISCTSCGCLVCIKHNSPAFICFCYCAACRIETYNDSRSNYKMCLGCKRLMCLNCMDRKCVCRCPHCKEMFPEDSKVCDCVKSTCHVCTNKSNDLLMCSCGLSVCRCCGISAIYSQEGKVQFSCGNLAA